MCRIFEYELKLKIKDNILQIKDCELIFFMKV